jgi:glycosyltransferase involved in cell wall biosynthesis
MCRWRYRFVLRFVSNFVRLIGLQAMANGTPVILRNVIGNNSIVDHNNNGLLFNTSDEFIECAKSLMRDSSFARRLCSNAQEFIRENHSPEAERRGYAELVELAHV